MEKENKDLNKVEINQLVIAKQLFLHGYEHGKKAGPIDKMIAIHNFHNSIEIILKTVLYETDTKIKDLNFDELIGEANKIYENKVRKELPHKQKMKNLNHLRNQIQHSADIPSAENIDKYSINTRLVLEDVTLNFFGFEFDEISLIELIEDTTLKKILKQSTQLLNSDMNRSMILITRALSFGISQIHNILSPNYSTVYMPGAISFMDSLVTHDELNFTIDNLKDDFFQRFHQMPIQNDKRRVKDNFLDLLTGFEYYLGSHISLIGTGIDFVKYRFFIGETKLWNSLFHGEENNKRIRIDWPKNPNNVIKLDHAEELMNYVIDTLVEIQNKGIELKIPEDYSEFFRILSEWDTSKINIHEIEV